MGLDRPPCQNLYLSLFLRFKRFLVVPSIIRGVDCTKTTSQVISSIAITFILQKEKKISDILKKNLLIYIQYTRCLPFLQAKRGGNFRSDCLCLSVLFMLFLNLPLQIPEQLINVNVNLPYDVNVVSSML